MMACGNGKPPKKGTVGGSCRAQKHASRHAMLIPRMAPRGCPRGSQPCPCLEAVPHCTGLPGKLHTVGAFDQRLFSTGKSAKKSLQSSR